MKGTPCQHVHPFRGAHKDLRRLGRQLERAGLRLERTKHNHVVVLTPAGQRLATLGINRANPMILRKLRRDVEQALGRPLAA